MNEEKEKKLGTFEYSVLFIGGAFFLLKLWERIEPKLLRYWYLHHLQLIALSALIILLGLSGLGCVLWNRYVDRRYLQAITAFDEKAVYLGKDEKGNKIYLKQTFRTSHTQVIGTTGSGKTESVILPAVVQDIENGSGLLIIDGKSDNSFLEKLYAHVVAAGRQDDFRLFSLSNIACSSTFNPLYGSSPQEVVERVFSSFEFQNEYYRHIQYKIMLALVTLLHERGQTATFRKVHRLLTDMTELDPLLQRCEDPDLRRILTSFRDQSAKDRAESISGLDAYLSHFCTGKTALLFNDERPMIDFDRVLRAKLICYFQLPTMYVPFLAQASGKMVLQSFQTSVSKRHLGLAARAGFFSCYLDDFQDYIYPGFGTLVNKANSAHIGIVFSHQAMGDLDKVSPAFRNIIGTNTNVKVVMRNNDPETCEYFAKSFGTTQGEKVTERQQTDLLMKRKTGEGSVRDVEKFIYHPNEIRNLQRGEGIVAIPHPRGIKMAKVQFSKLPEIPLAPLPTVEKYSSESVNNTTTSSRQNVDSIKE